VALAGGRLFRDYTLGATDPATSSAREKWRSRGRRSTRRRYSRYRWHLHAAKLYLTWFLAREQQSRLGSFSSRVDVPPPEGFQPLASYKVANNHREFMTNDKLVADLRKRFEGYTGPPANKGGVR
jgi:hypothetical protein